jgi:hypothetical protein
MKDYIQKWPEIAHYDLSKVSWKQLWSIVIEAWEAVGFNVPNKRGIHVYE